MVMAKKELLNTSQIARRAGVNRATVRAKLEDKGVRPRQEKAREKLYDADEALKALQGDDGTGLRKAQTIKTATEAERARLKLEKERGDVVSKQEVRTDLQEIIKRIYQHFAVTAPQELAPQLKGVKVAQIAETLARDAERFFGELRAEHESYLE
jgi:hypothetical protein